ncbi:MAG: TIM barrel protein [Verrucomicrobiota bacterium]
MSLQVKPILALSTCWNSFRHNDGYVMLREIADLGFEYAELSHGIRIVLLPGVIRAVEEGVIKISSIHNFCPLPAGVNQAAPNLFEPSSRDHRELDQWLRHTKRSLDLAAQVKARVMVTHLGSVQSFWFPPSRKIKAHLKANPDAARTGDKVYEALLRKACERLRKKMPAYWDQVLDSLEQIRPYAVERGIAIGCENREKFEELPIDVDFGDLFSAMSTPHTCGYWHDTGHAEIKHSMGLIDHRIQLEQNVDRLLGFHLHDVSAKGKDHQPVGTGRIDFEMISSFWQPHHLLTLELSPRVSMEDVELSKQRVEAMMARRFPGA